MDAETRGRLVEFAHGATPGPWKFRRRNKHWHHLEAPNGDAILVLSEVYQEPKDADATFIGALSPEILLALLDALTTAERERDEARDDRDAFKARSEVVCQEVLALRAENVRMRSVVEAAVKWRHSADAAVVLDLLAAVAAYEATQGGSDGR